MISKERHFYDFGPYRIDPDHRLLLRANQAVPLQPKAFDILLVLVENNEKVVLKDDLMKTVWPGTFVEESNLAQNIFVLRKTLGDAVGENRYIVTVPGRGYRFAGKVQVVGEEEDKVVIESHSRSQVVIEEVNPLDTRRAPAPNKWRAGGVVVLAVLAGLAIAWFGWRRVEKPRELTERQLTANPLEDWVTGAAISPDGKYVAYHDQTGVYLRTIESGETHPVALPAELSSGTLRLFWFPGGGKLLAEVGSSEGFDIWMITILGEGEARLLYRHGSDPAISPDGQMIAFTNFAYGKIAQAVWVGGINAEAPRKLVDAGPLQMVSGPAWSPDGRWIAYARKWKTEQGAWTSAIEVRPARGGPAKTLVAESSLPRPNVLIGSDSAESSFAESWSSDWRLVFVVSENPEFFTKYSLWEVQVEPGTGEAASTPGRRTQWSEFWPYNLTITADGKRLSLMQMHIWSDVYVGELDPGGASMKAPRRLTLDDRGSSLDAWTRDSQAILFDSTRNGRAEIFTQSLNENVAETVVAGPRDVSGAEVSPDGAWFLYAESESTGAVGGASSDSVRLMRRAVRGGPPEMVLELPRTELDSLVCSSNPKASSPCVLGLHEGKDLVFYSLDPVRGKGNWLGKIEVTARFMGWGVSPDGSRLALVDQDSYGGRIEVLTLSDGAWHEVSLEPEAGHLRQIAWAADGKSFFVTSRGPNSFDLLHVTLTAKVQPLLRKGRSQYFWSPIPSPDGKYLAFSAQTFDSNVWVIDNF